VASILKKGKLVKIALSSERKKKGEARKEKRGKGKTSSMGLWQQGPSRKRERRRGGDSLGENFRRRKGLDFCITTEERRRKGVGVHLMGERLKISLKKSVTEDMEREATCLRGGDRGRTEANKKKKRAGKGTERTV